MLHVTRTIRAPLAARVICGAMIPAEQLELHRSAIAGHCYRMMGSPADADDAVQETMVRAWRNLEKFDPPP